MLYLQLQAITKLKRGTLKDSYVAGYKTDTRDGDGFQFTSCLCFKTSPRVKPAMKTSLIYMKLILQAGHIFLWMVSHEDSL